MALNRLSILQLVQLSYAAGYVQHAVDTGERNPEEGLSAAQHELLRDLPERPAEILDYLCQYRLQLEASR